MKIRNLKEILGFFESDINLTQESETPDRTIWSSFLTTKTQQEPENTLYLSFLWLSSYSFINVANKYLQLSVNGSVYISMILLLTVAHTSTFCVS